MLYRQYGLAVSLGLLRAVSAARWVGGGPGICGERSHETALQRVIVRRIKFCTCLIH
jgi:hypothetical protein